MQTVHLYGHASGAQSWHIIRPSAFVRSRLIWNAFWHKLQARKRYFSCKWQAVQTSDSAEKNPSGRYCVHRVHREVEVPGGTCTQTVHTLKEPRPMHMLYKSAMSCRSTSNASAGNMRVQCLQRYVGPNLCLWTRPASYSAIIVLYSSMASEGL